jgi:hypothetical protein
MSTPENEIQILAERIVEAIMPAKHGRPINRIVLMSGKWPDNERQEGGLIRQSVKDLVIETLRGGAK